MPSINTETRIDIRALATLARYYLEVKGLPPNNRSSIIRTALEDYVKLLVSNGVVSPIDNNNSALDYCRSVGIIQNSRRISNSFFKEMAMDKEIKIELEESIDTEAERIANKLRNMEDRQGTSIPSQDPSSPPSSED